MAKRKFSFIWIPIFFNVVLLAGVPFFRSPPDGPRLIVLIILGLTWPWIMGFFVGKILEYYAQRNTPTCRESDDSDFV